MWIRRNNIFARTGQNNGVGPNIQSPNSTPFNPNHRRYRTCCCHSKAFTLNYNNNTNTPPEAPAEADRPMAKRRRKRQLIDENGTSGLPQSSAPDVMALIGQKSPLSPETPPNNEETPENRPVINGSEETGKMDDQEDLSMEARTNSL
uniref:Uncharacterized protein n=1 Tax=Meloidogyne javanica TaxID=6303 RepID=A0A915N402_MELJA